MATERMRPYFPAMVQVVVPVSAAAIDIVVALGMPEDGKVALIAGVTKDLTAKVHAGKLIQALAKLVGGSGGGRPDLAEAGGKDTAALKNALLSIPAYLEHLL